VKAVDDYVEVECKLEVLTACANCKRDYMSPDVCSCCTAATDIKEAHRCISSPGRMHYPQDCMFRGHPLSRAMLRPMRCIPTFSIHPECTVNDSAEGGYNANGFARFRIISRTRHASKFRSLCTPECWLDLQFSTKTPQIWQ
jgi:hypothetical protein